MNCYSHREKPAVGVCKACGKGLCGDCVADVGGGLACRDACEERVRLLNRIVENNEKVIAAANTQVRSSALFILTLGVLFCLLGFLPLALTGSTATVFMGVIGLVFAAYGAWRLARRSQYYPAAK